MTAVVVLALAALAALVAPPPLCRIHATFPQHLGALDRRWQRRRRPEPTDRGLADFVLLLAVGLLSGLSVSLTIRQIARTVDSPEARQLSAVVERQRRGQPLLDAMSETLLDTDDARAARRRDDDRPASLTRTIALLRSQIEDGAPVADALLDLSTSLRDDARRRAETRARRLPVRMLLPLIVCVLPGFLCLTVAPVIVESLRGVTF